MLINIYVKFCLSQQKYFKRRVIFKESNFLAPENPQLLTFYDVTENQASVSWENIEG